MRAFIKQLNENVLTLDKSVQKDILKFSKRLESYSHVPTNEKEILRTKPFASNQNLVAFVLQNMQEYPYPAKSDYPFDTISYWYCIALFIVSEEEKSSAFVLNLINEFIEKNHNDLWQFRRLLESIELKEYQAVKKKIDSYFLSKQIHLESYKWAEQIGLELPKDNSWMFYFEISTDGKFRFGNDLSEEEKVSRLRLKVSVYPLQGEKCWEIELSNWKNSVSAWWPTLSERTIRLSHKPNDYTLKTKPSLQNLKELIKEIESVFNISFDKTMYNQTFKGKIKNKNAIQKWLLEA